MKTVKNVIIWLLSVILALMSGFMVAYGLLLGAIKEESEKPGRYVNNRRRYGSY